MGRRSTLSNKISRRYTACILAAMLPCASEEGAVSRTKGEVGESTETGGAYVCRHAGDQGMHLIVPEKQRANHSSAAPIHNQVPGNL